VFRRMSFNETPDWLDRLGFINRLSFTINPNTSPNTLTIQRGGLIFGYRRNNETIGYLIDNNQILDIPALPDNFVVYITMDIEGNVRMENGIWSDVVGISGNLPGIPWYGLPAASTFPARALIGKIFGNFGLTMGSVVCDDPFWCEFEGEFQ